MRNICWIWTIHKIHLQNSVWVEGRQLLKSRTSTFGPLPNNVKNTVLSFTCMNTFPPNFWQGSTACFRNFLVVQVFTVSKSHVGETLLLNLLVVRDQFLFLEINIFCLFFSHKSVISWCDTMHVLDPILFCYDCSQGAKQTMLSSNNRSEKEISYHS